jgi:hypothetical protein
MDKLDTRGLVIFAVTAALLVGAFAFGADEWIVAVLIGALFGESLPQPLKSRAVPPAEAQGGGAS